MTERPVLQVVRGDAEDDEIAAVLVVLAAAGRPITEAPAPEQSSTWADRSAALRGRRMMAPGPHAWRTSFRQP